MLLPTFSAKPVISRRDDFDPFELYPTIEIGSNTYTGQYNPRGFYKFADIRYGMPPTGERRFRKPEAVPDDVLLDHDGPRVCPQAVADWECQRAANIELHRLSEGSGLNFTPDYFIDDCRRDQERMFMYPETEDCLFLDVFVPATLFARDLSVCGDKLAPVAVTFGEEMYVRGFKAQTDGGYLTLMASRDIPSTGCGDEFIVSVAANFRLGMFGWLTDDDESLNAGLLDQRLALE
ncbi:Carboxylesterase [Cercophora newfieldiana]|uniref:Carboxylesterase n=1 Tax=Cercophora newfieldiana TaxID=92897 RepID=A0AA40D1N9_9PEZI|nr:Carboxylesterase [Cercophora newfieldiana]